MFGQSSGPVSTAVAPATNQQQQSTSEIIQFGTPFSKLPASIQTKVQDIDGQFQKHSMTSSEIERLLEDAERSEQFAVSVVSKFEQRLRFLQLEIRKTKTCIYGFRDQVRRELKHGEQALFSNARLKHKSIQQLWPQLPSRFFWDKIDEFRETISKLSKDVEDIQSHLNGPSTQMPPPQVLHSLLTTNHDELVALSSALARIHSIINQQKEIFLEAKVSKKENPFQIAPAKPDSSVSAAVAAKKQQQILLLAPPTSAQQPVMQPGSTFGGNQNLFGGGQIPAGQPSATGLFGATSGQAQQPSTSLFGTAPGPTQQQQPGASSLFGAQQPNQGLFGATASQQQKPGLFGQSSTNFGSGTAAPSSSTGTGGLFGSTTMGQQQQPVQSGSGLFSGAAGQAPPVSGGLFGAASGNSLFGSSAQQIPTGTGTFGAPSSQPFQFGQR